MGLPTAIPSAGRSGAPPLRVPPVRRGVVAAVGLAVLTTLIVSLSPALAATLQLDRERFLAGEAWRLVTCHLTHWNAEHLAFDLFAFALLFWLCLERSAARTMAALASAAVIVPTVTLIAHPELQTYRGLSGLDSALGILLCVLVWREGRRDRRALLAAAAAVALLAFVAKIVFELTTGTAAFADSGDFFPVPVAHAVGAVLGALAGSLMTRRAGRSTRRRDERLGSVR